MAAVFPGGLITDTSSGVGIYPPQPGQAFGTWSGPPSGTANPDHPTWMKQMADEVVALEANLQQYANDYGDSIAPASPSAYNDEFTSATLNTTQWTVSGTGVGATVQNQLPTYLQMQVVFGASTTATTLKVLETIVSSSTFMWQCKVRFQLGPYNTTTAGSSYQTLTFALKNTTANKAIAILLQAQYFYSATQGGYFYPLTANVSRGAALGTSNSSVMYVPSGLDIRMRIGVVSGNLVCQISNDGTNWLTIWSEVFSSGLSLGGSLPNQLWLQMDNAGSTAGMISSTAMLSAWDYVRMLA